MSERATVCMCVYIFRMKYFSSLHLITYNLFCVCMEIFYFILLYCMEIFLFSALDNL